MERWERLPEALRWILYLPVVVAAPLVIAFILRLASSRLMPDWRWSPIAQFLVFVIGAYLAVVVFFPLVFVFAPRGKKIAGWCFYVPLMLWSAPAAGRSRGLGSKVLGQAWSGRGLACRRYDRLS